MLLLPDPLSQLEDKDMSYEQGIKIPVSIYIYSCIQFGLNIEDIQNFDFNLENHGNL